MKLTDTDAGIAFFDSTYREALSLTREARDYVAYQERRDKQSLSPVGQLAASCESMRMTARLTQVMSWLLVQKAVHAGELSREQAAAPELRLSGQTVCGEEPPETEEVLPPRLRELLERSLSLYQRVARLDAMFDQV